MRDKPVRVSHGMAVMLVAVALSGCAVDPEDWPCLIAKGCLVHAGQTRGQALEECIRWRSNRQFGTGTPEAASCYKQALEYAESVAHSSELKCRGDRIPGSPRPDGGYTDDPTPMDFYDRRMTGPGNRPADVLEAEVIDRQLRMGGAWYHLRQGRPGQAIHSLFAPDETCAPCQASDASQPTDRPQNEHNANVP